jgi:hypothetical protein
MPTLTNGELAFWVIVILIALLFYIDSLNPIQPVYLITATAWAADTGERLGPKQLCWKCNGLYFKTKRGARAYLAKRREGHE